jgi:hypothetical protein
VIRGAWHHKPRHLAREAGCELACRRLRAEAYIEASVASLNGDNSKLAALLADITEPINPRPF